MLLLQLVNYYISFASFVFDNISTVATCPLDFYYKKSISRTKSCMDDNMSGNSYTGQAY